MALTLTAKALTETEKATAGHQQVVNYIKRRYRAETVS
jgi:hypothetical protein